MKGIFRVVCLFRQLIVKLLSKRTRKFQSIRISIKTNDTDCKRDSIDVSTIECESTNDDKK